MKKNKALIGALCLILLMACSGTKRDNTRREESGGNSFEKFLSNQSISQANAMPIGFKDWVMLLGEKPQSNGVDGYLKEVRDLHNNFASWCLANQGFVTSAYKKGLNGQATWVNFGDYSQAIRYVTQQRFGAEFGSGLDGNVRECLSKDGVIPIGAMFVYMGGTKARNAQTTTFVGLLDPAGMGRVVQIKKSLEDEKRDMELERQRKENEVRQKIATCMSRASAYMRANLKAGISTNRGMVVEVKPPIASVQSSSGVVWVRIEELSVPSWHEACLSL